MQDTLKDPKSGDNNGREVNKEHFVELKNLTSTRPENEGSEEEESKKREAKNPVNFVGFGHGHSLAWKRKKQ